MRSPGIAFLIIGLLIPAVSAANTTVTPIAPTLSAVDLFSLFIGGVIYINIFAVVLYHVVKRQKKHTGRSPIVQIVGLLAGIGSVALGSLFTVFIAMVFLALFMDITLFAWMEDFFLYLITDEIPLYLPALHLSMTTGLLLFGAAGTVFFILGAILLVRFGGYGTQSEVAMPTGSGAAKKNAADRPDEPLNPVLSFRVEDKQSREPSADVKVILKHKDGVRFHTKYTDFNGEVTFANVDGFGSEYYAYVDGDINRQHYRVIRI
ncbi:MAG: hypothetical protein PWP08_11 [Methanofollis sp.]|nr:hypothetical protein [Methanofollis sp.]